MSVAYKAVYSVDGFRRLPVGSVVERAGVQWRKVQVGGVVSWVVRDRARASVIDDYAMASMEAASSDPTLIVHVGTGAQDDWVDVGKAPLVVQPVDARQTALDLIDQLVNGILNLPEDGSRQEVTGLLWEAFDLFPVNQADLEAWVGSFRSGTTGGC